MGHKNTATNFTYPFQFDRSARIAYRAWIFAEVDIGITRVTSVVGGAFPQVVIQHTEIANAYVFGHCLLMLQMSCVWLLVVFRKKIDSTCVR